MRGVDAVRAGQSPAVPCSEGDALKTLSEEAPGARKTHPLPGVPSPRVARGQPMTMAPASTGVPKSTEPCPEARVRLP